MKEDIIPEELPGYKKKSFSMPFGGGEIWFEHLDGIFKYENLVLSKLEGDKSTFIRPSMPSLICFNLDETDISQRIISAIVQILLEQSKHFSRVCFVGVDRKSIRVLKKQLKGSGLAMAFIDDFEKAKQWLVKESII